MPNTAKEWLQVADERGKDAATLKKTRRLAAIYIIGYAVECHLKAYLQFMNKPYPRSGQAGHDLFALWEACGFKRNDFRGNRRLFLNTWTTNLRYEPKLENEGNFSSLFKGAFELIGYIQTLQRRTAGRRRR